MTFMVRLKRVLLSFGIVQVPLFPFCTLSADMEAAKNQGLAAAQSAMNQNTQVFANEGQGGFQSFQKWGMSVNPEYKVTDNPKELEQQAANVFSNDETVQIIKKSHDTRELVKIDLDHVLTDVNGQVTSMPDSNLEAGQGFEIRTCRTMGETYETTCQRQRILKVKVIPEKQETYQYCPQMDYELKTYLRFQCKRSPISGGCRTDCTTGIRTIPAMVEVLSEQWVGCENEDQLHQEGICALTNEIPGKYHEERIIEGQPFKRDYWETTRHYQCGAKVVYR